MEGCPTSVVLAEAQSLGAQSRKSVFSSQFRFSDENEIFRDKIRFGGILYYGDYDDIDSHCICPKQRWYAFDAYSSGESEIYVKTRQGKGGTPKSVYNSFDLQDRTSNYSASGIGN